LPAATPKPAKRKTNYAVNNETNEFPKVTASWNPAKFPVAKVNDGNYWYHISPPNRWTCAGSTNQTDWCIIDFGVSRTIDTVKLYFLDDGENVIPPSSFELEAWNSKIWAPIPNQTRSPQKPTGHRANVITFPERKIQQLRAGFGHAAIGRTGLTEFEAWGPSDGSYSPPSHVSSK
jgi:hypothetical protein